MADSEYIIEFRQVSGLVKVSAIDPKTGIEVSIPMPTNTPRKDMMRLAVRKLEYVLLQKTDKDGM